MNFLCLYFMGLGLKLILSSLQFIIAGSRVNICVEGYDQNVIIKKDISIYMLGHLVVLYHQLLGRCPMAEYIIFQWDFKMQICYIQRPTVDIFMIGLVPLSDQSIDP